MDTLVLYKCLSDETRLGCLLLLLKEDELCVCELITALNESQPKISRHLALLKQCQLVSARRKGTWIFYRLDSKQPSWVRSILQTSLENDSGRLQQYHTRLSTMTQRPSQSESCC